MVNETCTIMFVFSVETLVENRAGKGCLHAAVLWRHPCLCLTLPTSRLPIPGEDENSKKMKFLASLPELGNMGLGEDKGSKILVVYWNGHQKNTGTDMVATLDPKPLVTQVCSHIGIKPGKSV